MERLRLYVEEGGGLRSEKAAALAIAFRAVFDAREPCQSDLQKLPCLSPGKRIDTMPVSYEGIRLLSDRILALRLREVKSKFTVARAPRPGRLPISCRIARKLTFPCKT